MLAHDLSNSPPDQLAAVGIKSMIINVCCDDYAARSVARMKATVAAVKRQAQSLKKQSVAVVGAVSGGTRASSSSPMTATPGATPKRPYDS